MGGSSKSETSTAVDPQLLNLYKSNYATAGNVADNYAYVPYTGEQVAPFNPTQTQAQGVLSGVATDPSYQAANNNAIGTVNGVLGDNSLGSAYKPAQIAGTDLAPYMNPFQKNVIDASISQNQYARDQQGVADNAAATAAKAFGGTRQAVQRAETTAGYDRNDQQNIAALNSVNFTQAQNAAGTDVASQNAAKQFNTSSALAAAGLKLNAAGQLVSDNTAGLNIAATQGGLLSDVGGQQQQQQQAIDAANYQEFLRQIGAPLQAQNIRNQALGMIPLQQTSTTNSTTSPGAGGILGGIASLGLGFGSLGSSSIGGKLLGSL